MMKILVASDYDAIRSRITRLILKQKNNKWVEQGGNMRDVLDSICKTMFDVIVFDIDVDRSCLFHLLNYIKHKNPGVSLIYLSDVSIPAYQQKCLDAGVDHFLGKTSEFEQIVEIIDRKYEQLEKKLRLVENN